MVLFVRHTVEQHTDALAAFLPDGETFAGKTDPDANLYKFLFGMANTMRLVEDTLQTIYEQHDYRITTDFLEAWEGAVGIPDDCFKATGSIARRRTDIAVKILANGTQTDDDFVDLAAQLGVTVRIIPGIDETGLRFPFEFPTVFDDDGKFDFEFPIVFSDAKEARFTMIVEFTLDTDFVFPYEFTFTFGDERVELLKCLFRKLAPANVQVIYRTI